MKGYEKTQKYFKSVRLYEYLQKHGSELKAKAFADILFSDKDQTENPLANYTLLGKYIDEIKGLK